jgi:ElaB/YqjD/DUF883 family membrane-anchored ribosome-binding protein
MKCKNILFLLGILLITTLFLVSCADKEKQEMQQGQNFSKQPMQKPTQGQMNQTKLCGDGICDAAEQKNTSMCPADCEEETTEDEETTDDEDSESDVEEETSEEGTEGDSCTDDTDCDDGYYCKDDACTRSMDIKENVEQNLYNQLDAVEDRSDSVFNPFDDLYEFLESKESDMSEDDYEDIDDAIDTYYEEVEADVEEVIDTLNTMTGEVASLTTAELGDFNDALQTLRDTLDTLRDEVHEAVSEYYVDIYEAIDMEGPDLLFRGVVFSPDDSHEEGTFTLTVKNVGTDDVEDEYEVEMRLVIEGSTVDTCTEDGDGMESLEEEEISCDFDISEYYELLYDEEESSLDVEVRVEIDTEDTIEEINEENNEVTYETMWTLEMFE